MAATAAGLGGDVLAATRPATARGSARGARAAALAPVRLQASGSLRRRVRAPRRRGGGRERGIFICFKRIDKYPFVVLVGRVHSPRRRVRGGRAGGRGRGRGRGIWRRRRARTPVHPGGAGRPGPGAPAVITRGTAPRPATARMRIGSRAAGSGWARPARKARPICFEAGGGPSLRVGPAAACEPTAARMRCGLGAGCAPAGGAFAAGAGGRRFRGKADSSAVAKGTAIDSRKREADLLCKRRQINGPVMRAARSELARGAQARTYVSLQCLGAPHSDLPKEDCRPQLAPDP